MAEKLPDCTGNTFGAHNDLICINFPAKRLKGKPGQKMRDELRMIATLQNQYINKIFSSIQIYGENVGQNLNEVIELCMHPFVDDLNKSNLRQLFTFK
jgi:hypothetical protein